MQTNTHTLTGEAPALTPPVWSFSRVSVFLVGNTHELALGFFFAGSGCSSACQHTHNTHKHNRPHVRRGWGGHTRAGNPRELTRHYHDVSLSIYIPAYQSTHRYHKVRCLLPRQKITSLAPLLLPSAYLALFATTHPSGTYARNRRLPDSQIQP